MHNRLADTRINSCTARYTLCEKLVKIGKVVFELKWGRKWKFCCDSSEISRFSFIWHIGVLNGLEYHNFDVSSLIGNYACTSRENLIRFGLVIPEF